MLLDKLAFIENKYDELSVKISDPSIIADQNEWRKLCKEQADLEVIVNAYKEYKNVIQELKDNKEMLAEEKDRDMREMIQEDISSLSAREVELEREIQILLLPKDPNDEKNVFVEIRAGAGGEEAALFGMVLLNMYRRFAERKRWNFEISELNETDIGGVKEAVFTISGKGAYSKLKFESGVHRVQRVPETESQGRIHTSTTTVAVLPEVEDVDFEILDKDIRIDVYRSSGAGGQKVNKTETAIRITHIPTGIVVACQDERSQLKNKERAFSILKSKLYDHYKSIADSEYASNRKSQVGTGDRCERIRTYNYPQGRVTDHRINLTVYNLEDFLDGNIEFMCDELNRADQKAKLESQA